MPWTLAGSPALISLHLSHATKPLTPVCLSLDLALVHPALQGHPRVPQTGAGQIKQPPPARESHFLSQSHILSPLASSKDSRIRANVISALIKDFPSVLSWHWWLPPAFSGCPFSWGHLALISAIPASPHHPRLIAQHGSNTETWELDGVSRWTALNDPCGQLIYLLCGPLCNSCKTRALASSKAQRNTVAARISPNVNILTRGEKKKKKGVCVNFPSVIGKFGEDHRDAVIKAGVGQGKDILWCSLGQRQQESSWRGVRLNQRRSPWGFRS